MQALTNCYVGRKSHFASAMAEGGRKKREKKRVREVSGICKRDVEDIEDFSPQEAVKIRSSLLRWYYENQRDLPWSFKQEKEEMVVEDGREVLAYAVWVSEVMLQQTQVSAVLDYYNRWMEKWPTVRHLAEATQEEVNEMWAGLGYYRRARFLLEGAKSIVIGGEFPATASALRKVKGIGDYTAGAIASIAFKEVVPVVDGNVIRVISRLKAISANPKDSSTVKTFWKLAGQLVDSSRPGDFNQSLMELGAIVCTRSTPKCSTCPISSECRALSLSTNCETVKVTDFPVKVLKAKKRHDFAAVCVVEITNTTDPEMLKTINESTVFILVKRPEEGLLAGLWEFPSVLLDGERLDMMTRRKAMDQYLKKLFNIDFEKDARVVVREEIGECIHIFSHIRLEMHIELLVLCLQGGVKSLHGIENTGTWKYIDRKSIKGMGLTSGVRKVYNMIEAFKKQEINSKATKRKKAPKR